MFGRKRNHELVSVDVWGTHSIQRACKPRTSFQSRILGFQRRRTVMVRVVDEDQEALILILAGVIAAAKPCVERSYKSKD